MDAKKSWILGQKGTNQSSNPIMTFAKNVHNNKTKLNFSNLLI